jgi:ABC-2 type transport system ATP-binding protein
MAVIEVDGLTKRYGEVAACDGISFDVEAGECVALLGPNGAGKTTTVEILEGYRSRDTGTVSVLGVDPAHPSLAWRRRIGIVLQSATDVAELTVAEVVEHFARYYPNGRDPAEVIAAVGLEAKRDARTRALSGGQRRRLDVALGILGRPELLFLDEPTTGFDPAARRDFWSLIDGLKADGTTIVLTTHYLEEADVLADRVVVIVDGTVAATGTPTQLGGGGDDVTVAWRDADGNRQEVVTSTPTRLVAELAGRFGGEVPDLEVRRPTLEDVYLRIIARESA